jgi:hypothetical protein
MSISHEGLRLLLHQEGVSFQVITAWRQSTDPDFVTRKNRIRHQYGLMDGTDDDPDVVICMDEFGLLNLSRIPAGSVRPRRRRRVTFTRRMLGVIRENVSRWRTHTGF